MWGVLLCLFCKNLFRRAQTTEPDNQINQRPYACDEYADKSYGQHGHQNRRAIFASIISVRANNAQEPAQQQINNNRFFALVQAVDCFAQCLVWTTTVRACDGLTGHLFAAFGTENHRHIKILYFDTYDYIPTNHLQGQK